MRAVNADTPSHFSRKTSATPPLVELRLGPADLQAYPWLQHLDMGIPAGLTAVTGDERSGKTTLLRLISGDLHTTNRTALASAGLWLDLRMPDHDADTPEQLWRDWAARQPHWNAAWQEALCEAFDLREHAHKPLFMLSTGSRRKVGLLLLLCSGAAVTCIDQPYAGLDLPSIKVLREFLRDQAEHTNRAWVVADYTADAALPWRHTLAL